MSEVNELEETLKMVAESAASFAPADAKRARRVRDQHEGHDPDFWRGMAEQGWLGVLLSEEQGGTGLGLGAAASIAERLGYACHSEPFVSCGVVLTTALLACPASVRISAMLADIVSGKRLVSLAWQAPLGDLDVTKTQVLAKRSTNGFVLQGSARFVAAPGADRFVVLARIDEGSTKQLLLCELSRDAQGLSIHKEKRTDGSFSARLQFNETPVGNDAVLAQDSLAKSKAGDAMQDALNAGVLCSSAELLGLINRSLELTLGYLAVREQFGQAIGAFQVLQHRAVDMWMQKELTRAALRAALDIFEDPSSSASARQAAASSVKSRASQTAQMIAAQSVQLHGAIGTTDEYELGVYVNRSLALASDYGNASLHRRLYGELTPVQEREINEWADSLGTTAAELKEAVQKVGIAPHKVGEFLIRVRANLGDKAEL